MRPAESREFSDAVISRIAVLPISRHSARHDLLVAVTLARFSPQSVRRHAIVASSTKRTRLAPRPSYFELSRDFLEIHAAHVTARRHGGADTLGKSVLDDAS